MKRLPCIIGTVSEILLPPPRFSTTHALFPIQFPTPRHQDLKHLIGIVLLGDGAQKGQVPPPVAGHGVLRGEGVVGVLKSVVLAVILGVLGGAGEELLGAAVDGRVIVGGGPEGGIVVIWTLRVSWIWRGESVPVFECLEEKRGMNVQMTSPWAGVCPSTLPPLSQALLVMALEMGCRACEYEKLPMGWKPLKVSWPISSMSAIRVALLEYVATPNMALHLRVRWAMANDTIGISGETYRCPYAVADRMVRFVRFRIPIEFRICGCALWVKGLSASG